MNSPYLNNPPDLSEDYHQVENWYYLPSQVESFNEDDASGQVRWKLHRYSMDWFFNKIDRHLVEQTEDVTPGQDYDLHPLLDFSLSFISDRTLRLRMKTTTCSRAEESSLMVDNGVAGQNKIWQVSKEGDHILYTGNQGSVSVHTKNFSISVFDVEGKLLTSTVGQQDIKAMNTKSVPFSFVRKASDFSVNIAASFLLSPDEKIYGCGESFTSLNKRGQKLNLFTTDAQSTASQQMYKPIPFFFSSRGYGMFVHTSAPLTVDFGYTHADTSTIYSGDEYLDLFIFLGNPQEILEEYTALTGRSPLPPLWSFGLWMGCFSYRSEEEVREVAHKMREMQFPCDVIHIDAGWFKEGINCDFEFNKSTFSDPEKMISDLKNDGFRISLWQIPYFTPNNPLYSEIVQKKLYVKNGNGNVPTEDAILDFTNEDAVRWYEEKISRLLEMGISAIKVDFGESAPVNGIYNSGKSGWFEHNLYPLRYNKIVSELTKKIRDEDIIWARSAWAGSQRYPLHWGGDAEVSDAGMAGTLRGGLSLGLSGFSFWSHDIGGFSGSPVEELFGRWAFFGLMSSHSRVHGFPPREPWHFSDNFQNLFRLVSNLRYKLIPYIYSQAAVCSKRGLPLMKALLLNYPDDPVVWNIDDQFLLGDDILVAPVFEKRSEARWVYLPEGKWLNHTDKAIYEGAKWHRMNVGGLRGIILYRCGALIPAVEPVLSTAFTDWKNLKMVAVSDGNNPVRGKLRMPDSESIHELVAVWVDGEWKCEGAVFSYPIRFTGYQFL